MGNAHGTFVMRYDYEAPEGTDTEGMGCWDIMAGCGGVTPADDTPENRALWDEVWNELDRGGMKTMWLEEQELGFYMCPRESDPREIIRCIAEAEDEADGADEDGE